jgi:hypothetical protein
MFYDISDDTIKQFVKSPSYNYNNLPFFTFNYTGLSDDIRQYLSNLKCDCFLIEDNIDILLTLKINNNSGKYTGINEYLKTFSTVKRMRI